MATLPGNRRRWLCRLMGADEAGTARVLREHRAAVGPIVVTLQAREPRKLHFFNVTGTGDYGTDQCAPSSAWKLVIPESTDPVIAVVASTPRGKSTLMIEARKIAAIGRAMTK
jgi:hypothetical protein